jgi:hypothetical protein
VKLLDYLLDLSNNPRKLRAFQLEQESALAEAKLSDPAKAALKSGDPKLIQSALLEESGHLRPAAAGAAALSISINIQTLTCIISTKT